LKRSPLANVPIAYDDGDAATYVQLAERWRESCDEAKTLGEARR
jgi:hypothetical protein